MSPTRLAALLLLLLSTPASAQWSGIGFRGLELGMDLSAVNRLVATSDWSWMDGDEEAPQYRENCGGRWCYLLHPGSIGGFPLEPVRATFDNGTLWSIDVASLPFDATDTLAGVRFVTAAIAAVTAKYGEPGFAMGNPATTVARYFGTEMPLASWEWFPTDDTGAIIEGAAAIAKLAVGMLRGETGIVITIAIDLAEPPVEPEF